MTLQSLWRGICVVCATALPASALTLEDAILYVLETNPEIRASEFNKQAIEFELDQAQSFLAPRVELEARAGAVQNNGTTQVDSSAYDGTLGGWETRARVTQRLFDGFETRSEIERQAYRVDGAALRVLERSEFLALEATRLYADMLRIQEIEALARANIDYHVEVLARVDRAFESGVLSISDLQQAEERTFVAEEDLIAIQLELEDMKAAFLETVGVDPVGLGRVPSIARAVPANIDQAIATARQFNPSVRFVQADVGAADAQRRLADSNQFPTLNLEAEGRYGEDPDGFEGTRNDVRVGLVLRYEFQGGAQRAARQEQVRRAAESRAELLRQSRYIEREMRQSWASRDSVRRQIGLLEAQVAKAFELRTSYEQEFEIGRRSLLDILNTQGALFQSEVNLVNARSLDTYVSYRILAAAGILLRSLNIEPPVDATPYAAQEVGAPPVSPADAGVRFDATSFRDWRRSVNSQ